MQTNYIIIFDKFHITCAFELVVLKFHTHHSFLVNLLLTKTQKQAFVQIEVDVFPLYL